MPLKPELVFEDISQDHARKTVISFWFPFILLILWYTQRNARIGQILPYIESTCLKLVELNLTTYVSCWELSYIYWSEKGNNLVSRVTGYTTVYILELNVVHLFILQCVILKFISAGGFTFTEHLYPCLLMAPVTRVDALTVACVSRSLLLHGLAACSWRYLNMVLHVLVGWPIMPSTSPPSTCRPSAGCLRTIYALWNVIRALFLATTNRLCLTCDLQQHECKPPLHPCAQ